MLCLNLPKVSWKPLPSNIDPIIVKIKSFAKKRYHCVLSDEEALQWYDSLYYLGKAIFRYNLLKQNPKKAVQS